MHGTIGTGREPTPQPPSPWFAGAAIGLAVLSAACSAMVLGSALALTRIGYGVDK